MSLITGIFRLSLNKRKANGLPGRSVGVVVAPKIHGRWLSASTPAIKPRFRRLLKTLNPERLVHKGQEIFDLSEYFAIRVKVRSDGLIGVVHYGSDIPFPPGTKGVFYYHQPPALPPLAGEMRFRICEDPSQFTDGRDLEVEPQKPWAISVFSLVRADKYKGIRKLLLDEGFIDHELKSDIENMQKLGNAGGPMRGINLYDIDQPFLFDLNSTRLLLCLNTRSCIRSVLFQPFSITDIKTFYARSVFSGRIRAQFELDAEERMLRLRVLEIVTPVTRNPPAEDDPRNVIVAEPRPGELVSRGRHNRPIKPWICSLTRSSVNIKGIRDFLAERALEKQKYGV